MANPPPNRTTEVRAYRSKNAKASTEIQEDPELWRDIHNNVRKMDDLYDATFYTWLKSEDNVLVTASYLQRLAGEYDHDRIEHALCWLVHGWRLESIAVLVKQVTFDWIHVHGEQGEKNRARLVLALTDNWAIQYIARLAGTLLTSAATPSPPPTLLTFTPCHSRMASLPGSPIASPSLTSAAATWGSPSPQTSARSGATFSQPISTPSSPLSSHQPLSTFNTPQPTQGRRMAVSRRLGSPMAMSSAEEIAVTAGRPASMSSAAESYVNSGYRSNHHRQSSSTLPGQQQHQPRHQLLQQRTSSSSLSSSDHTHQGIPPLHPSASTVVNPTSTSTTVSDALSIAAAAPVYPSPSQPQSISYHPHHCTVSHHPHHHQHHPPTQPHVLSPQLQHHRQALHRAPVHIARTTHGPHATHVRQSSQPGNISSSKQHWLQQQSSYAASPIFYMNKSLFMEELSRKWSFCRLSEFFQCLDPASGISHRFKCKLLKESGLKDELRQKQKLTAGAAGAASSGSGVAGKDAPEDVTLSTSSGQEIRAGLEDDLKATTASISVALMNGTPSEGSTTSAPGSAMDIVMTDSTASGLAPSALGSTPVVALSSTAGSSSSQPTLSTMRDSHVQQGNAAMAMHPLDTPMETVAVTCSTSSSTSPRSPSVSAPIPLVLLQQEQTNTSSSVYRPLQTFGHGQQQNKDNMHSGLNGRGFRNADGNHQHSRAQTVEAIMSKAPTTSSAGPSGLTLSPTSSTLSCNSTMLSPMPSPTTSSTMAASASLSNLSLTEQPIMEPTSRPLSQQQSLSPYTTHFSGQMLYRHGVPPHSVPAGSSSGMSSSSSTTATSTVTTMSSSSGGLLTIHTNGQQQQQQQQVQGQQQQSQQQPQPQRHHPHDSTSAKRKSSLSVNLVNSSNCSSFSSNGSSSVNMHSSSDGSLSSSSAIFPGPRRTSTSASTTNEDLKRLRCSRQNSTTSSASGI
ncbi:hypothetical protein BGZ47_002337 [Haplosporangium gracile]|nr:hypothetical protein BGZ47_002337 [Haplosporangium gracile]